MQSKHLLPEPHITSVEKAQQAWSALHRWKHWSMMGLQGWMSASSGELRNQGGSRQSLLLSLPCSAAQGRCVRMVVRPAPLPGSVRPSALALHGLENPGTLFSGWGTEISWISISRKEGLYDKSRGVSQGTPQPPQEGTRSWRESRCSCAPSLTSVAVFITRHTLSHSQGRAMAPDFQGQAETHLLGFSVPVREDLIAPGTRAYPGSILYRLMVWTWLPTASSGGSEAVPRRRGGGIRSWANHSQSVYFRWKIMTALKASLRAALGISVFNLIRVPQQAPPSDDCPVLTMLCKHSQCVHSSSGGYAFKMPGHHWKEMVLFPQSTRWKCLQQQWMGGAGQDSSKNFVQNAGFNY